MKNNAAYNEINSGELFSLTLDLITNKNKLLQTTI